MAFSNMSYDQVVSEKARLEAELEAIKREQRRHDEIIQAQRKAVFDRLPRSIALGLLNKNYDEFRPSPGCAEGMEWHEWVALAQDIIEADQVAMA